MTLQKGSEKQLISTVNDTTQKHWNIENYIAYRDDIHTHFRFFVRSMVPPREWERAQMKGLWCELCCLHACVYYMGRSAHIFVRPIVMIVYICQNFSWESLSSREKNNAGVIRLEFAHNTWCLKNSSSFVYQRNNKQRETRWKKNIIALKWSNDTFSSPSVH